MQRLTALWLKHCQESAQSLCHKGCPTPLRAVSTTCSLQESLRGADAPMEVCGCQPMLLLMHQG